MWRYDHHHVAACAWLLSASWSFDLYWLARRGFYPDGWARNLLASSALYLAAGVLWNLEWRPWFGVGFAFRGNEWPKARATPPFRRVAIPALTIMTAAGATLFWAYLLN